MHFHTVLSAALVVAAAAAQAQDIRFGISAGVAFPQGDLSRSGRRPDPTAGLILPVEFKEGHVVQPRLDYATHRRRDMKVDTFRAGVDYLYHPGGDAKAGFYLGAGLGLANTKIQTERCIDERRAGRVSQSRRAFAWAAGVGYDFSSDFGLDLRWNSTNPVFDARFAPVAGRRKFRNDSTILSVNYRF